MEKTTARVVSQLLEIDRARRARPEKTTEGGVGRRRRGRGSDAGARRRTGRSAAAALELEDSRRRRETFSLSWWKGPGLKTL